MFGWHEEPDSGFRIQGCPATDILSGLSEDEKAGAEVIYHNGGNAIICRNLYKQGLLEKAALPKNRVLRWLRTVDWGCWSLQANKPSGACMATNARSKKAAILEARAYLACD